MGDNLLGDKKNKGCEYNRLMYIADWFPSILGMTGINQCNEGDIDGINVWEDIQAYCKKRGHSRHNQRKEIIQMRILNDYFYATMIRNEKYKLVINASRAASNRIITPQLTGYVDYDASFTEYPDEQSYNDNIDLFRSKCYDELSAEEKVDSLNFQTQEFMLFDIEKDPIEACNLYDPMRDNKYSGIVEELYDRILEESEDYNGGGFAPALSAAAYAQVLQFNCDLGAFGVSGIVPWIDYDQGISETDWNVIWRTLIDLKNGC